MNPDISSALNVLGGLLKICSEQPVTGFFRDGCCNTGAQDVASHTVCAVMTTQFLAYSKLRGNDLSTARPEYAFAGLKPGARWCVCAARWLEAYRDGCPPPVVLEATHQAALEIVPLALLIAHALNVADDPLTRADL